MSQPKGGSVAGDVSVAVAVVVVATPTIRFSSYAVSGIRSAVLPVR